MDIIIEEAYKKGFRNGRRRVLNEIGMDLVNNPDIRKHIIQIVNYIWDYYDKMDSISREADEALAEMKADYERDTKKVVIDTRKRMASLKSASKIEDVIKDTISALKIIGINLKETSFNMFNDSTLNAIMKAYENNPKANSFKGSLSKALRHINDSYEDNPRSSIAIKNRQNKHKHDISGIRSQYFK